MTQENKELLLKDLTARLSYGVKCIEKTPTEEFQDKNLWEIDRIRKDIIGFGVSNCYVCYGHYVDVDNIKPYLIPLSNMTEEQKEELFFNYIHNQIDYDDFTDYFLAGELWHDITVSMDVLPELIIWLLKNHFDIYDLIPKGLALDATNLNIY